MSLTPNQQKLNFEQSDYGTVKIDPDELGNTRSSILKALNDGIEEIDTINVKTQIEMKILLATLLELELTGTLENIRGQNIQACC